MKRLIYGILVLFIALAMIGCKADEEENEVNTNPDSPDTRSEVVSESLIDIPSAVSSSSSGSGKIFYSKATKKQYSTAPSSDEEPVWEIYEGIRENIGAMEEWAALIEELTEMIFSITGTVSSGVWENPEPSGDDPSRVEWGPDETNGYETQMDLYFNGQKGFEAFLSVNETAETAKGMYTWDFSVVPGSENETSNAKIQFIFDSTGSDGTKELTIKVQDMTSGGKDSPVNAWVKVTQDTNNIFTIWGNYYFPALGWFSDTDTEQRSYVFAGTGYDETGQSDDLKNMAVMQLALPTSDTTTDTYWSSASVGAIFIDKIKEIWEDDAEITLANLSSWTSIDLSSATTIDDLTSEQVIAILEWADTNADSTGADNFAELIYFSKMVNDAYFQSDGFLGTCYDPDPDNDGTCDQGTATTVPNGFDNLDVTAVASDAATPFAVKNLTIDFLDE